MRPLSLNMGIVNQEASIVACRFVSLLILLVGLSIFVQAAQGLEQKNADEAVKKFLSSQKSETEGAEPQDTALADLNGDGKPELVLLWTLMGPTYFHNTLTIFSKTAEGYTPVASLPLAGEANLSSVKNGIILVEQKVLAKNDPLCCPSIKKRVKYRWAGKKILEVKK
jgi:hypothetical protein